MAKIDYFTGIQEVLARLRGVTPEMVLRVTKATEITSVLIANHAKNQHNRGFAHAVGRYENQTTNLTNSIIPQLIRSDPDAVVSVVSTNKEYAPKVEFGSARTRPYPFMMPALMSQEQKYKQRIEKAIHGNA